MRARTLSLLAVLALPGALAAQRAPTGAQRDSLQQLVTSLGGALARPLSLDDVHEGNMTVAAGQRLAHDVVVRRGTLDVYGTIDGSAVAIRGDVVVHAGAHVTGDAVAVGGTVRAETGTVGGEMRTITGALALPHVAAASLRRTVEAMLLVLVQFAMLALIGVGLLLLAPERLRTVADTVRESFSRSFLVGVLAEVGFFPAMLLGIVLLAITILGILLIPFAVIALMLAGAGVLVLAFLAMAYVTGDAWLRRGDESGRSDRGHDLRALLAGTAMFAVLWLVASALSWAGWFGAAVHLVVWIATWMAVTIGAGAVLTSRAGARRSRTLRPEPAALVEDEYSWQTPTPVGGVAAARRPTPAPRPREL